MECRAPQAPDGTAAPIATVQEHKDTGEDDEINRDGNFALGFHGNCIVDSGMRALGLR